MEEQITQLNLLKKQIDDAWDMLDIDIMTKRSKILSDKMQQPGFWDDQQKAASISQEYEELRRDIEQWTNWKNEIKELQSLANSLQKDPDQEMESMLQKRITELQKQYKKEEFSLLFSEKYDKKNAIVTFHAGSGGTEAQDWAEMLMRMIIRYAEKKDWKTTLLDESKGQEAGIKSATVQIQGRYAFGHLKSEHGTHRLVRISPFDADKSRHTSFASIEVIPEIDTESEVEIDPNDLRIDIFMSGGKGGQSVNTTYSAVRIVHEPTGITVQCQNERSQLQNKENAMKVLHSKLQQKKDEEEAKKQRDLRGEYKSAEWGNQIRSYVLQPYKMVKDLRSLHETSDPDAVLDGDLDPFIEAYLRYIKQQ